MAQEDIHHLSPFTPDHYIYRDISLLEVQRRVLEQAREKKTPLLERVKFLAIFSSNMDEFFMLRMSGIHGRVTSSDNRFSFPTGNQESELTTVRSIACELYPTARSCLHQELAPRLEKSRIHLLSYTRLNKHQKQRVYKYFKKTVLPLLIPLPLGIGHAFPHISNL